MQDLMRLSTLVETIGASCGDVQHLCRAAQNELLKSNAAVAVADLQRALKLVRHATALGNVLADVLEAIDTQEIADGDMDATYEAVGVQA